MAVVIIGEYEYIECSGVWQGMHSLVITEIYWSLVYGQVLFRNELYGTVFSMRARSIFNLLVYMYPPNTLEVINLLRPRPWIAKFTWVSYPDSLSSFLPF